MHVRRTPRGFTLIELLLAIAIIGLIASVILIGQRSAAATRRDVKRYSDVKTFEQGLSLYFSKAQAYPTYTGCINGTDPVTAGLHAQNIMASNVTVADPSFPNDPARCYYYTGTPSAYTLRYVIEVSSIAGPAGPQIRTP
jgi:prepilin-type N-terminal cleavage/methylation domain-containing protein